MILQTFAVRNLAQARDSREGEQCFAVGVGGEGGFVGQTIEDIAEDAEAVGGSEL